ncbi:MAG: hypothetical protein HKP14_04915 [Bacteroidia bacterium]|nr:hypothetical protein [Bacteroidia bacterium]
MLDLIQLVGFPLLYLILFNGEFDYSFVFEKPYNYFTYLVIGTIVICYFIVTYFRIFLEESQIIFILILLGAGLFINLIIMYNQEAFLSIFNIPILLLFIMQIASNTTQLTSKKYSK